MPDSKETLLPYRERIDEIDQRIVKLFGERYRVRDDTMPVKINQGLGLKSEPRVEVVKQQVKDWANEYGVPQDFIEELYEVVLKHSHKYEAEYRQAKGE